MNRDKIRICIIRHGYFPQDPRVRKEVKALLEQGYKIDVICLRDKYEQLFDVWQGVKVYRVPLSHKRLGFIHYVFEYLNFFIRAFFKVSKLHLKHRYDLIQINTMPDFLAFSALLPRLMGAKVVLDMHELMPEFFAARFKFAGASLLVYCVILVERIAAQFSHRIIMVSPLQASILKNRAISKTYVIVPNVPDDDLFSEKIQYNSNDTLKNILITHGTIAKRYGAQVIVRALPCILKEISSVRLYIVGDGEYLKDLKNEVLKMGLKEYVIFTGRVSLEDVSSYISQATVGVVPFLNDGYIELAVPNKLFEYIAMKKPVLAADVPGIRVYFDERHVEFFKPGEAQDLAYHAIALLKGIERRTQLAFQAKEAYENIHWKRMKIVYQNFIEDLIVSDSG